MLTSHGEESLVYRLNPGGGVAYKIPVLGFAYGMLESDLDLGYKYRDWYTFGAGPSVGVLSTITDSWKLCLSARALYYELGDKHKSLTASLTQNFKLNPNNGILLMFSQERTFDHYQSETKASWNIYF